MPARGAPLMPGSVSIWVAAAVLLFWSVGAYNRLVRLRAAAMQAFAALDTCLRQHVELAQAAAGRDEASAQREGLRGAAAQFAASLGAARARPLDGQALDALAAAQDVLAMAWLRMCNEAHDLAGSAVPDTLEAQWQHLANHTRGASDAFNAAVAGYNAAIAQFPAILLAWVFGFKPARPI
jgi:LemA protein